MANDKKSAERESTEEELTHILEEARMILPGIQALIGFQFIAVFNDRFKNALDTPSQFVHYAAVGLAAIAMSLLLAPAAYHRLAEPHEATRELVEYASHALCLGLGALMLAICADFYLVGLLISGNGPLSLALAAVLTLIFLSLWYLLPLNARQQKRRTAQPTGAPS